MSDNPSNPNPDPTPKPHGEEPKPQETPKPAEPPKPEAPAQDDPTDWKTEARKWEGLAKKNGDAATRLAEIEEASKTEAQKQADALAAAESKVKEYEAREQIAAWKAEVEESTKVPAGLLAGSTKEEIEAHAAKLEPFIGNAGTPPETPRPGVVPTIGKTPANQPNIPIGEQIAAAEESGDKALVGQLKAMQLGAST